MTLSSIGVSDSSPLTEMAAPPTVSSAVPKQEAAPAPLSTDQHAVSYTAHPPPSSSELADSKPSLNKQDKVVYKLQSLHEMRCYSLIYVNMQPLLTIQNARARLDKIDHVIFQYVLLFCLMHGFRVRLTKNGLQRFF